MPTQTHKQAQSGRVKLSKAQRKALQFILHEGPGALPDTKAGRVPAAVAQLIELRMLETLNRIRPGPAMYEITAAGRAALVSTGAPS